MVPRSRRVLWIRMLAFVLCFSKSLGEKPQQFGLFEGDQQALVNAEENKRFRRTFGDQVNFGISGNITFSNNNKPSAIPANSQLKVELIYTSKSDGPHTELAHTLVSLLNYRNSTPLTYSMGIRKHRLSQSDDFYSISAVLNMGWKPKGNESLHFGDYHTTQHFPVNTTFAHAYYKEETTVTNIIMDLFVASASPPLENEHTTQNFPVVVTSASSPLGGGWIINVALFVLVAVFLSY